MTKEIKKLIQSTFDTNELFWDEPMKRHTSFKIGGPATLLYTPSTIAHLKKMLDLCKDKALPFEVMGNGSNLLVGDQGYHGVIIQIYKNLSHCHISGGTVEVQGGILLSKLSKHIYEAGLEGFEFASGIPGTLGGAVYMNAGAYGREMKDVLVQAQILTRDGGIKILSNEALELKYRHSALMQGGDIVLSARLNLQVGNQKAIRERMVDLSKRRKDKQPIDKPSAGSTFKRPQGYYAGKLIMDAGLRGYGIGGAQISEKHCGFIINTGAATAKDVVDLIEYIQGKVKEQFDVMLEPEVRMIGRF